MGSLARELGSGGRHHGANRRRAPFDVQGLLVNERFTKRLMAPADLDEYTLVSQHLTSPLRREQFCLLRSDGRAVDDLFLITRGGWRPLLTGLLDSHERPMGEV